MDPRPEGVNLRFVPKEEEPRAINEDRQRVIEQLEKREREKDQPPPQPQPEQKR